MSLLGRVETENEYTTEIIIIIISLSIPADKSPNVYIQAIGQADNKICMAKQPGWYVHVYWIVVF